MSEPHLLKMSFSSVPVISQSELVREYQELGETLGELTVLGEEEDEWQVEAPVLEVAGQIATELMVNAFPAPVVFNHGPKSVVYNWSSGLDNLYLTVSADRISALITSPERIKRRIEYSLSNFLNAGLFPSIQSAYEDKQITVIQSGSSERSEPMG